MELMIVPTADGSHTIKALAPDGKSQAYHSSKGAIKESIHVFIQAGLQYINKPSLSILEVGFGTGLNALLTYLHSSGKEVRYNAVEPFPLAVNVTRQLNYPDLLDMNREAFDSMHTIMNGSTNSFILEDSFSFHPYVLPLDQARFPDAAFDLIYFDAFSPTFQPEMWGDDVFRKVYAWTKLGGILVTYCAQSTMQRALKAAGFTVERLPGAPGKREMVRATKVS